MGQGTWGHDQGCGCCALLVLCAQTLKPTTTEGGPDGWFLLQECHKRGAPSLSPFQHRNLSAFSSPTCCASTPTPMWVHQPLQLPPPQRPVRMACTELCACRHNSAACTCPCTQSGRPVAFVP
mmetsp:Transcript_87146/g.151629  ORF Transcript_87146/g.151629 Transcript_87146/m.151629 type:complete len:123 (-) Transcript_87146:59-427(-)